MAIHAFGRMVDPHRRVRVPGVGEFWVASRRGWGRWHWGFKLNARWWTEGRAARWKEANYDEFVHVCGWRGRVVRWNSACLIFDFFGRRDG